MTNFPKEKDPILAEADTLCPDKQIVMYDGGGDDFTAIQNAAVLEELNEKIKGAFAKSEEPRLQERGHSQTYCCYYHAPTLVIVSNEPTQWWAAMDCACAMQNIFLAAKSLGIGSCWINQLGADL